MNLYEMEQALNEAQAKLNQADTLANTMAKMLRGRMRQVWSYGLLKELKAELRDYNAATRKWRERR